MMDVLVRNVALRLWSLLHNGKSVAGTSLDEETIKYYEKVTIRLAEDGDFQRLAEQMTRLMAEGEALRRATPVPVTKCWT